MTQKQPQPQPVPARRDNPNLARLEEIYAEWGRSKGGNVGQILDMMHDDIEMRSVLPAEIPHEISGTHSKKEQAAAYFKGLLDDWEMLDWDVDRFIADGDDVVMVGSCCWRNRANGEAVRSPKVDIWHFEDGKATSFMEMFDTRGFARAIGAV